MSNITLPVSLGEALDKLTILDIKVEKIKDQQKKIECQKERDALYVYLDEHVKKFAFWYKALKAVNLEIWNQQDTIRAIDYKEELAKDVLDLNDMRFRIKHKINTYSSSFLKEQKGYANKNILLEIPLTLKELFQNRKILYYLSIDYDNVYIIPKDFSWHELFEPNIHLIKEDEVNIIKQNKGTFVYNNSLDSIVKNLRLIHSVLDSLEPNSAIFFYHLGIGDTLNMNGAVNYLCENHDEIYIISYSYYYENTRILYNNNYKVKIISVSNKDEMWIDTKDNYFIPSYKEIEKYFNKQYRCGLYLDRNKICTNFPISFYEDINLSPDIRFSHCRLPCLPESKELYDKIKDKEYIFVQQKSSSKIINLVKWDKQKILTIDPNINVYEKSDPFYELAEEFVNKPFFHYNDTIQNASQIYLIDSSFSVLVFLIPNCKARICKICCRDDESIIDYSNVFLDKDIDDTCKKYNIIPIVDNSIMGKAMGLGDLLIMVRLIKLGLIRTPIPINISIFKYRFNNPANALEFRIQFLHDLLKDNNLPNDAFYFIKSSIQEIDNQFDKDKNKFQQLDYHTPSLPNFLEENKYIVIHTKCRQTKLMHYDTLKDLIEIFCKEYKTTIPIVLLGEREFSESVEAKVHGITTVYTELLHLKANNIVYDLTEPEIYDNLDYNRFKKDSAIIKGARINISFGLGGSLCISMAFGKKTFAYVPDIHDIFYDREILKESNIFFNNDIFDLFDQIKKETTY